MSDSRSELKIELKELPGGMKDLSKLPTDVIEDVLPFYLSDQEMAFFSATHRSSLEMFKKQLEERQLKRLFHDVLNGNWAGAEQILRGWEKRLSRISKAPGMQEEAKLLKDRHLLKMRLKVKDFSGRIFQNITLFEYAIWAKDVRMVLICLKFLPREDAVCQFKEVEANVTYRYLEREEKESSYNPRPLLEAHNDLARYAREAEEADSLVEAKLVKDTLHRIHQLQKMLPACFVLDLCDPRNMDLSAPAERKWTGNYFSLEHCPVGGREFLFLWFHGKTLVIDYGREVELKPRWEKLARTGFISPEGLTHIASCIAASGLGAHAINSQRQRQLQVIKVCLGIHPAKAINPIIFRMGLNELLVQQDFVSVFGSIQPPEYKQYPLRREI